MCVRWRGEAKNLSFDPEDRDILALAMDDLADAVVQVFFVREGRLIGREHFHVTIGVEDTKRSAVYFISQYYTELRLSQRRSCSLWKSKMQM